VLDRTDGNSHMSWPDNEITRLRTRDPPKFADSTVKVRGADIFVGKTSTLIDGVDEVRTIRLGAGVGTGFQCGAENRQALVQAQRPSRRRISMAVHVIANRLRGCGRVVMVQNGSLCR